MGEANTGKSCLIKRYCEQKFVPRYISTIGVDFGVRTVNVENKEMKVNFWDLSGQEEFFEVRNEFYKDTQGALLVFDVTSKSSFTALEKWASECEKYGGKNLFCTAVCANKVDLAHSGKKRQVTETEAKKWAVSHGFEYFETSAQTGDNVNEMFDTVFRGILKGIENS
eukprot:CAMPEP_0175151642 /NCGR_PEP_ID=MMETSP0087-20121206/18639_1 /TAXON_ID=136419 /ORGANISM="Unknown Unknown, Strain D1" /LENGTH=167 /DNA_ID=CAMNT_0016437921 /DNA_START=105 /DNA_END=608 /DNA_ORIENTATION=-